MGLNQMLFVVGAILLLGVLAIPAHRVSIGRDEILLSTEASNTATALGQALLQEIIIRKFDEQKCGTSESTDNVADFSSTMGTDAGLGDVAGNPSTYDDIDDFNGYTRTVNTIRLGDFVDSVKVYYVTLDAPDAVAGMKTFLKRVDVKVRNQYLFPLSNDSSVTVSKIVSYRYL